MRYKGTIGGDISHGDPGNDHPALMLALGASFVLRGASGERVVPADGFFLGTYDTLLQPDEIMTADPHPGPGGGHRLLLRETQAQDRRFRDGRGGRAAAHEGGVVEDVRIALTNVGPTPLKATRRRSRAARQEARTTPRSPRRRASR